MSGQHLLDIMLEEVEKRELAQTTLLEVKMPVLPYQIPKSTFHVLLKHIEFITATQILVNEQRNHIQVTANDTTKAQHAIDCLSVLETALRLLKQHCFNHHIFLPEGIKKLQLVALDCHPTVTTMFTLMTHEERRSMLCMCVLVPKKSTPSKTLCPIIPRSLPSSRYWEAHKFQSFDNTLCFKAISSKSSARSVPDSSASQDDFVPQTLKSNPRGNFILVAPKTTAQVSKWATHSTQSKLALDPRDLTEIQLPKPHSTGNTSPEPKNVPGVLKRRVKPRCHETMDQQTPPAKKIETKQTTLDDFFMKSFKEFKLQSQNTSTAKDTDRLPMSAVEKALRADANEVEEIFNALQPALEAAKCFPGALELEVHIELVTIDTFCDNYKKERGEISLRKWKEIFQQDLNRTMSSFQMWNKVTASGTDVDSIVDLKWAKISPARIFGEEPTCRAVAYECYCLTKDGFAFVISIGEKGQASFRQEESELGLSTIHFPHRNWDLNLVLKGAMNVFSNPHNPILDTAINNFIKTTRFQAGDSLEFFCVEPTDKLFSVTKILMKRWTQHEHLPQRQEVESKLMLKVLEVQEFVIGRNSVNPAWIRGRIPVHDRQQCASNGRLWFEISILSEEIQKLLLSNRDLELGQKTKSWYPVDLLGDEFGLKGGSLELNPVASAIGASGFGSMLRLGKAVLDRMRICS